jgi:hypothetical protein
MISKEPVVLINLPKRSTGKAANVVIRGVTSAGLALRPQVKLVEGRMFQPGTAEVIAGRSIADGFQGAGLGETLRFASRDWPVVGVFDAGRTGFDSEIWGDAEQMLQAFRRNGFSSIIFKLADADRFDAVKATLESDPRLTLEAKREKRFYAEQSEALSKFISYLGTGIRSSSPSVRSSAPPSRCTQGRVAHQRNRHAGARSASRRARHPRCLSRRSVAAGIARWCRGPAGASAMQALSISTTNFQTFAEIAFLVHADARHRRRVADICARHGLRGWLPAGRTGGANEDRRRTARGVAIPQRAGRVLRRGASTNTPA